MNFGRIYQNTAMGNFSRDENCKKKKKENSRNEK
jgi:hypothetical protein